MKAGDSIDFDNGYEVVKELFGELIFKRECQSEELATKEQIEQFNRLVSVLNVSEERVNKLLTNSKALSLDEISKDNMNKCINFLKSQIDNSDKPEGEAA
jgi:hypothetical protein